MKASICMLAATLVAVNTALVAAEEDAIRIHDAWIREAPPGATALAAYMEIENIGDRVRILREASSPAFGHIMLHGTRTQDGLTRMIHLEQVEIAPHSSAIFQPGGNHLMLMQPNRSLSAGDQVAFELDFADGLRVSVSADVRKVVAGGAIDH